jgi:hypothetical protein
LISTGGCLRSRALALGPGLVADAGFFRRVGARPGIAAEAAQHRLRHPGLDHERRQDHRHDLAGAAVVHRRREAGVDAEAGADELVVGVGIVRAAADDAVDLRQGNPGIGDGVCHRLNREVERADAGHLAEARMADADDGAAVADVAARRGRGVFEHG